jgi:hypothetical protein
MEALMKSKKGDLKECRSKKQRKDDSKHFGSLSGMKHGELFSETQVIVLARLAGGVSSIRIF